MNKRLTERDEFGNADIIGVGGADLQLSLEFDELNAVTDALNRLATLEDILFDASGNEVLSLDRLREIAAAAQSNELGRYRFYYCESEDSYLLGARTGNFYYAHWHDGLGFVWDMSKYLPWGETIYNPGTAWKEHTYPSEPKEIDVCEWFFGFLKQRTEAALAGKDESQ